MLFCLSLINKTLIIQSANEYALIIAITPSISQSDNNTCIYLILIDIMLGILGHFRVIRLDILTVFAEIILNVFIFAVFDYIF